MDISLHSISKQFGSFTALDNIDLNIGSGELIALLGPSGSGKTTLLRIIAGLEFADNGDVYFGGDNMIDTPLRERQIGFVFQHYALFKHMNVRDNVGFGLQVKARQKRLRRQDIHRRANELLELVQLGGLGDRYPHQLSGGQRQRVALARALAIEPRVLLLDEPFGALDAKVRKELRQWLRTLHRQTGVTTLFVTHDQEEALELADRVVIMDRGQIAQVGSVDDVYEHPATPMVFDFLGSTNILPARLENRTLWLGGQQLADYSGIPNAATSDVDVYVRPADLRLSTDGKGLAITVTQVQRTGPLLRVDAELPGSRQSVSIELPHLHHDVSAFREGAELTLRLVQFSVFGRGQAPQSAPLTPTLIGRERERSVI